MPKYPPVILVDSQKVATPADAGKEIIRQYQKKVVGYNLLLAALDTATEPQKQEGVLKHLTDLRTRDGKLFFPSD